MRSSRAVLSAAVAAIALVTGVGTAAAAANPPPSGKTVSYLGLNFTVPADWPVIDLAPTTCVRFDRHAVYLGTPGKDQRCPAHAVGGTEALLVQPATSGTTSAVDNVVSREITVTTRTATITAGYAGDRAAIDSVLASAGLPTPKQVTPTPSAVRAHSTVTSVPADATDFTGQGFDTCDAPSQTAMDAWKANSPYSAVGIYIGGASRACKTQANLTASWVQTQYTAGWRFLPIYVGPQASSIDDPQATANAMAADAATDAQNLGFAPGTVLYYDIEDYATQYRGTVLAFAAAWTAAVHQLGYHAGIYGSVGSAVADLVSEYGGLATPDVIYNAHWNNVATTDDAAIPATDWANHQRVHQYASPGNQTYGGVQISIDQDYLDVGVSTSAVTQQKSAYQAVTPKRLLDTRNAVGVSTTTPIGPDQTIGLTLTGLPSSVTAVVLNVTAVSPTASSYLTVYGDGMLRSGTSSVNFTPGETIPNLVTAPVYDGVVDFYNHIGTVHVLADLFGYYTTTTGSRYHPATPTRLLDTRNAIGVPKGALGPGQTLNLTVAGVDNIPAGVTAVIMNFTAVNPTDNSYLTAFASGTPMPAVSNLNFSPGETIPNLAIVPVHNGMISVFNHVGSVDVLGDVQGYFTADTAFQFTPVPPTRMLDTGAGVGVAQAGPLGPNGTIAVSVSSAPADVDAVVLNVTAVAPTADSYLAVYPDGQTKPNVSNLNYSTNETIANAVMVPVTDGSIDFYNHVGSLNVDADIAGYFEG